MRFAEGVVGKVDPDVGRCSTSSTGRPASSSVCLLVGRFVGCATTKSRFFNSVYPPYRSRGRRGGRNVGGRVSFLCASFYYARLRVSISFVVTPVL